MSENAELLISVSLDDGDEAELQDLTRRLQSEIEQLHIDSVDSVHLEKKPEGTKGTDWVAIGEMVVTLTPIVIPPLFDLLKSWINRQPSTPVKIKVKVGRNKTAQVEYDPTKTSAKDLDILIKTLRKSINK